MPKCICMCVASISAQLVTSEPSYKAVIVSDLMGVWMQAAVAVQESKEGFLTECPPCQAPVPTACLGGHTTKPLPCCSAAPFSCGDQCGQPLACGNHTCSKPCHDLTAELGSNQGMPLHFTCFQTQGFGRCNIKHARWLLAVICSVLQT